MRRFFIGTIAVLGVLSLASGPAVGQYVTTPGDTPDVGGAGFSGQSTETEVRGESVEFGDAVPAGSPAAGADAEAEAEADAGGDEFTPVPAGERELLSDRAGGEEEGGSRFFLALTGLALTAVAAAGFFMLGGGEMLRRLGRTGSSEA